MIQLFRFLTVACHREMVQFKVYKLIVKIDGYLLNFYFNKKKNSWSVRKLKIFRC